MKLQLLRLLMEAKARGLKLDIRGLIAKLLANPEQIMVIIQALMVLFAGVPVAFAAAGEESPEEIKAACLECDCTPAEAEAFAAA